MKTLQNLYDKHYNHKKGWPDKGTTHSYIEVYEELLKPYRTKAKNILEIGLMSGESLRMWTEYFSGDVHGIDCSETPVDGLADLRPAIQEGILKIWIGDASDPATIEKYFKGIKFDVVIEDASHDVEQQLKIYSILKDYMAEGSIYIVEDVQDIDKTRHLFWPEGEIIDRRKVKHRYDDCLIIMRHK